MGGCAFQVSLGAGENDVFEILAPMRDGKVGVVVCDGGFKHAEVVN